MVTLPEKEEDINTEILIQMFEWFILALRIKQNSSTNDIYGSLHCSSSISVSIGISIKSSAGLEYYLRIAQ